MAVNRDEVLSLARGVLEQAGVRKSISSVKQLNSAYFTSLYNKLVDEEEQKLTPLGVNERSRIQMIIDSLKRLLPPQISLSHISGRDIAKGDLLAIKNLLEIFSIIFEFPLSSSNDSNALTGEGLKVVAQVLEEELNSSSIYIPTAVDSAHSSIAAPPTHHTLDESFHSALLTPPTNPLMSLDTTPTASSSNNPLTTLPLDQSTPHKGPKSRLGNLDGKVVPPLSISSLSTTSSNTTHPSTTPIHDNKIHNFSSEEEEEERETEGGEETGEGEEEETDGEETGEEEEEKDREETEEEVKEDVIKNPEEDGDKVEYDTSSFTDVRPDDKDIVHKLYHNYITRSHRKMNHLGFKGKGRPVVSATNNQVKEGCQQTANSKLRATVQDAFPGLELSPASDRRAWHLRMRQLNAYSMRRPLTNSTQRKNADIERRHKALLDILKKELNHSQRMHNLSVKRQQEKALRLAVHTQRSVAARSQRYYSEYEVSVRKKLQRERTKEEQIYKRAFEECLEIQRENKRELVRYAKEKEELANQKHRQHLESLQTFYETQLALIAEAIEKEQRETAVRERTQKQASKQTERRLRKVMEEEIKDLWSRLDNWEEDNVHFRSCDKELVKGKLIKSLPSRLQ